MSPGWIRVPRAGVRLGLELAAWAFLGTAACLYAGLQQVQGVPGTVRKGLFAQVGLHQPLHPRLAWGRSWRSKSW